MFAFQSCSLPNQLQFFGRSFPAVYVAEPCGADVDVAAGWITENRERLLAEAAEVGVLLFRGAAISTAEQFDTFLSAFRLANFKYEDSLSNAVRVNFTERVFSANEAPPDVSIYLHHEMAQTPIYPSRLFFYCLQPAAEGGATPVCRSDALYDLLAAELPEFLEDCEHKGLRYSNVMPAENDAQSGMGRSWGNTFRAAGAAEAETRMKQLGYSWEWLDDGALRATTPVLPAVRRLANGRKSFFNQLIAAFQGWKDSRNDPTKAITYGDGTPLDADAARRAAELAEQVTFDVAWEQGDVALVDNFVAMHGRRHFRGTRRVLASLVAADAD